MNDIKRDTKRLHDQFTAQIMSTNEPSGAEQTTLMGTKDAHATELGDTLPSLPGYTIEGVLGRGGMGVVYKAIQKPINRPVALKMILSGEHAGEAERLRFLAEAESIAKIQHPGIVQLFEFGNHHGYPYFALEYVNGGTLEKRLSGTPLPAREAAILVEKLASAMQVAHDLGIVHRDLKPSNILLNKAGEPKITDFGLAKTGGSNLTATGAILGTPSYMAPEQADGGKKVGPLADIYALGAILYECLTGRPPFKAATQLDTILQVVHDKPVSVCVLNKTIPANLAAICHTCLEKEPAHRYISARSLSDDLNRFLNGDKVFAKPSTVDQSFSDWFRSHRYSAGLTFVTIILLLANLAVLLGNRFLSSGNTNLSNLPPKTEIEKGSVQETAQLIEEDLKSSNKRVEGVRVLGTIEGHWWPEATDQLIASLRGDRVEAVRIEAAKSLANGKCSNKKTLEALQICIAGSSRDGFPAENSELVKAEAKKALAECQRVYKETPLEKSPKSSSPEIPAAKGPAEPVPNRPKPPGF